MQLDYLFWRGKIADQKTSKFTVNQCGNFTRKTCNFTYWISNIETWDGKFTSSEGKFTSSLGKFIKLS